MFNNGDYTAKRASDHIIIYHKDCMDGLSSAFIASEYYDWSQISHTCLPIQYGEDLYQILKEKDFLHGACTLVFVDFSTKRKEMLDLAKEVNNILIIDHHKTAQNDLLDIDKEVDNIELVFDMSQSGVMLTYYYYFDIAQGDKFLRMPPNAFSYFKYIQDRDLWKWEMDNSMEISEFLRFKVIPNNVEEFGELLRNINVDEAIKVGTTLVQARDKQVESKIKKVKRVVIGDIELMALNITENISEVGNAICKKYNCPALMYFITEQGEVVFSFRSMDHLADVSPIAKYFNGGGHRNACGAGNHSLETLWEILNNMFHDTKLNPIVKTQLELF